MEKNHLDFVAPDILIERDSDGVIWLTQGGEHFPFPPNMEFTREIVDLREEGYLSDIVRMYEDVTPTLTLIRAAVPAR